MNSLAPHPFLPLLATSGTDSEVKVWEASAAFGQRTVRGGRGRGRPRAVLREAAPEAALCDELVSDAALLPNTRAALPGAPLASGTTAAPRSMDVQEGDESSVTFSAHAPSAVTPRRRFEEGAF